MLNVKFKFIEVRHSEKTGKDYAIFQESSLGDTVYIDISYIRVELHSGAFYRILIQAFRNPNNAEESFLAYRVVSEL